MPRRENLRAWMHAFAPAIGVVGAISLSLDCAGRVDNSSNDAGSDSGSDSISIGSDTAVHDETFVLPDGRSCGTHDEDRDGVPDDCDNCPNIYNPSQGSDAIGAACAPGGAFTTSPTRIYFSPFTAFAPDWTAFPSSPSTTPGVTDGDGFFALAPDGDSFVGGTTDDTESSGTPPVLHFATGKTGAGMSAVVATTIVTVSASVSGSLGLLLRVSGAPAKFFVCAIGIDAGFAAAHVLDVGCNGGPCAPAAFVDASGGSSQKLWPPAAKHAVGDLIGIRASVTSSAGSASGGTFECRIFDPAKPSSLLSTDPAYAITAVVANTRWIPSGDVGIYAQRARAQFFSIDVLAGP